MPPVFLRNIKMMFCLKRFVLQQHWPQRATMVKSYSGIWIQSKLSGISRHTLKESLLVLPEEREKRYVFQLSFQKQNWLAGCLCVCVCVVRPSVRPTDRPTDWLWQTDRQTDTQTDWLTDRILAVLCPKPVTFLLQLFSVECMFLFIDGYHKSSSAISGSGVVFKAT